MKRNRVAVIGLVMAMTCQSRTSLAAAGNLVPNSTFDTDLSGWSGNFDSCSIFGGVCWSREDAVGSSTSGSAVMAASIFTEVATRLWSSCIPVTGGDDYTFGVATKFRYFYSPHDLEAYATATLLWSNDAACQSSLSGNEIRVLSSSWRTTQQAVTAPVDAVAAYVLLLAQVSVRANFDNVRLVRQVPGESTTTTTTMLVCERGCGDPVSDTTVGVVTASDALFLLRAAVGEHRCALCVCDVNDDGGITATDALLTLAVAVGQPVSLTCPP
jgi:hypothetical protein